MLKTLLHNRKTAKKQGIASTGNAARMGLSAPVTVAPSNLFFQPGTQSLAEMEAQMGDGLVITDLSGLHAGANTISGDFSLLSKGYLLEGGKRVRPVEQITVAGNFYQLLKDIRALGNDLTFPASGVGAPSVDVGTLAVSGKEKMGQSACSFPQAMLLRNMPRPLQAGAYCIPGTPATLTAATPLRGPAGKSHWDDTEEWSKAPAG